ncbi:MAG: DUF4199 domain-containing protein [Bacteroidota bacterium]
MKKLILTYGSIGGVVVLILMYLSQLISKDSNGNTNFELAETLGYVSMILALSVIFLGIKSYRDQDLGGEISFGKAFKVGVLITLVASAFYIIGWMIYYHATDGAADFMNQYMEASVTKMEAAGSSLEEINAFKKQSMEFAKTYENPLVMAGVTLMEIFPVGLVITLASSLILKKQ